MAEREPLHVFDSAGEGIAVFVLHGDCFSQTTEVATLGNDTLTED